eukprot:2265946-Amphidinium_carterae.2
MSLSLNKEKKLRKPCNEVSSDLFGEEAFPFHPWVLPFVSLHDALPLFQLRMASARERVLEAIRQHQWSARNIPLREVDE